MDVIDDLEQTLDLTELDTRLDSNLVLGIQLHALAIALTYMYMSRAMTLDCLRSKLQDLFHCSEFLAVMDNV